MSRDRLDTLSKIPGGVDYFVLDSFPSHFGHFTSVHYLKTGCNYIQSWSDHPISQRLLGVYLLHAFVFRDRLMETFYNSLALNPPTDAFSICTLLLQSFTACLPAFSEFHFQAVLQLRSVNDTAATKAVFKEFLLETVRLWHFSPLFAQTQLFSAFDTSKFPLVSILRRFRYRIASKFVKKFTQTATYTIFPNLLGIFIEGGIPAVETALDRRLSSPRIQLIQAPPDEILRDASVFYLRSCRDFGGSFETSPSRNPAQDQANFRKASRDFWGGRASALSFYETVGAAARSVLSLVCRSFAATARVDLGRFFRDHAIDFAREHIRNWTGAKSPQVEGLPQIIEAQLRARDRVSAVLETAVAFANQARATLGRELREAPSAAERSGLAPFVDALAEVEFALTIGVMGKGKKGVMASAKLAENSVAGYFPYVRADAPRERHPEMEGMEALALLMRSGERMFGRWFGEGREQESPGEGLLFFLELEGRLAPVLEGVDALEVPKVIAELMDWEDPANLRAGLLALLWRIQEKIDVAGLGALEAVPARQISAPLARLREWFRIKNTIRLN
jgi:hypothetical protein